MKLKKISLSIIGLLIIGSLLGACSSKPSAGTPAAISDTAESDTAEEVKNGDDSTAATMESTEPSTEQTTEYPIAISHAFGETVIEKEPERVATIAWGNQDVPLALGVVPAGVSKANFGAVDENGLLPWTAAAYQDLGVETPVVFDDTDGLDYEAISDAEPDVILAAYSGITQEEYELLSQIAPVVAYPDYPWQTYWREQTLMDAKGMGKEMEAKALISKTEELIRTKTGEYKNLEGKTAAFIYFNASDLGQFYVYLPTDPRGNYLLDLGLKFPDSVMQLAEDKSAFTVTVSSENIDILTDIDIIITYGDESVLKILQEDTLVGQIPAIANGSVVMMDDSTALTASCTPSVLSIPATIDEYLGLLSEAANKVK